MNAIQLPLFEDQYQTLDDVREFLDSIPLQNKTSESRWRMNCRYGCQFFVAFMEGN